MTKKSILLSSMALLTMGLLASCSSDNDYDDTETIRVSDAQFTYDAEGVWEDNTTAGYGNLNIDDYEFSHIVDSNGLAYGFTPSKITDISEHSPLYTFPYASASGGGISGPGSQYLVGYWGEWMEGDNPQFSDRTCRIYDEDGDQFQPQSVMVCNNTYLLYAALNGTDFTPKFGEGDWVTLNAHGVHLDGTESEEIFYLVNIESDNVKEGVLMAWKQFDLRGLGTCVGIYFTMDCSDSFKGEYGLNIPTYFCLDNLIVKD